MSTRILSKPGLNSQIVALLEQYDQVHTGLLAKLLFRQPSEIMKNIKALEDAKVVVRETSGMIHLVND